jgi:hypothetical protein
VTKSTPGEQLREICSTARSELVLCAPFIKAAALARVLEPVSDAVKVEAFTRWRAEEVAAGVSDTSVLALVESGGGEVYLCDRLHAKYARSDDRALVGSANLTGAALGWSAAPNLELLVEIEADHPEARALEASLRRESVRATQELADLVEDAAKLLPQPHIEPAVLDVTGQVDRPWFPQLREPFDLYTAYTEGPERLSRVSAAAARRDLAALDIPLGLKREQFETLVATRVTQVALIGRLGAFLDKPRRFGEVRSFLEDAMDLERAEAEHAWQTLMRWLLHFLPGQYVRAVPSHTEMVVRRSSSRAEG